MSSKQSQYNNLKRLNIINIRFSSSSSCVKCVSTKVQLNVRVAAKTGHFLSVQILDLHCTANDANRYQCHVWWIVYQPSAYIIFSKCYIIPPHLLYRLLRYCCITRRIAHPHNNLHWMNLKKPQTKTKIGRLFDPISFGASSWFLNIIHQSSVSQNDNTTCILLCLSDGDNAAIMNGKHCFDSLPPFSVI